MDVYDHRGKRLDDPEDEGPTHCDLCGTYYAEITEGHILSYDPQTDGDRWDAVNRVTGCMCSPEDLMGERMPQPPNLNELPF